MILDTIAESDSQATFNARPGRLKRVVGFARHCGRNRISFAEVEATMDGPEGWWPSEPRPGAVRASLKLERACESAYRLGQIDGARRAIAQFCALTAGNLNSPIVLFEIMAQATCAPDGPYSTMIEPADLVEIARPFCDLEFAYGVGGKLAERMALVDAKEALVMWHRPAAPDVEPSPSAGPETSAKSAGDLPAETATMLPRIKFDLDTEPGLLGDIARWSQVYAYRPMHEFALPAALATLAAIFGRRWVTPTGLGLNLYLVAIAPTGGGKDALLSAPRVLLQEAGLRHLLGPGDFTSDAAIETSLRKRPAQLMPLDEFGKLAQAMAGARAPIFLKLAVKALLEIYPRSAPGSEWTGKQHADPARDNAGEPIFVPTLSILGVSTPEGFFEGMTEQSLDDGFLNRLTLIPGGKPGARQRDKTRLTVPAELVDAIREAYGAAGKSGNLGEATSRSASAKPELRFARWANADAETALAAIEEWEDLAADEGRRGVCGRVAEQCQKIATLRALARAPADPAVSADDLAWAFDTVLASVEAIESGVRSMMAGSEFERLCNAIEAAIAPAGLDGMKQSDLVRAKGVSKADPRMVNAAIERLVEAEKIWRLGPAGKRYRLKRPDERGDA